MNDDWRLQIDVHDNEHASALIEHLDAAELKHNLSKLFRDRLVVTRDGARVFIYAGTRTEAEEAQRLVETEARCHKWKLDVDFRHWHPISEEWEDPEKPLPASDGAKVAEREALMRREREEAANHGYPEFEVRVDLPSRRDAVHLAEQFRKEGLLVVHRWRFLLIGSTDEDSASALAKQIQAMLPTGSRVTVEGTWGRASAEPSPSPFAVLGELLN